MMMRTMRHSIVSVSVSGYAGARVCVCAGISRSVLGDDGGDPGLLLQALLQLLQQSAALPTLAMAINVQGAEIDGNVSVDVLDPAEWLLWCGVESGLSL
jgi:hypothetical protein